MVLLFAKTLADSEINDMVAAVPPAFCYNSWPCLKSSACASERWFASLACDEVSPLEKPTLRQQLAVLREAIDARA